MLLRFLILLNLLTIGCAQPRPVAQAPAPKREADRQTVDKELATEMSLKSDREALKEVRHEIPLEKQKSNDELALYLNLMKQGSEQPQMVHDKFSVLVQKNRTSFREKVQKLRDNYRHEETKRREEFLDAQKQKRTTFAQDKHSAEKQHDFYSQQDRERLSFFSDEHDRRASFESEISAQSKDFDSYMHEKTNEFNEQFRLYSKKYSERPKEKKAVTGEGADFKGMDQVPSKTLGTED